MDPFTSVAPGRLCLFGEHQDYLNLPVIALAIPLKCMIQVTPTITDDSRIRILQIQVPALELTFRYDLNNLPPRQSSLDDIPNPDFALAAIHEALSDGWKFKCGANCVSTTDIVMQAGCSSSTAFCVAWVQVLARLASQQLTPIELAQRAHQAEVLHFGHPGGTMDHVSIALGGSSCLRIGPGMWEVTILEALSPEVHGVWILADSGEPKDTMGHLKRCKGDRLALLDELGGSWDAEINTDIFDDDKRQLLDATLTNRDTEAEAASLWANPPLADDFGETLGSLMHRHHAALRDGLGLSTPRLESMRQVAMDSGAWGYKLVGSGGGGCAVAWTSLAKADIVANAMKSAGAKSTWIIEKPSSGARIES
jgi:galactokinase